MLHTTQGFPLSVVEPRSAGVLLLCPAVSFTPAFWREETALALLCLGCLVPPFMCISLRKRDTQDDKIHADERPDWIGSDRIGLDWKTRAGDVPERGDHVSLGHRNHEGILRLGPTGAPRHAQRGMYIVSCCMCRFLCCSYVMLQNTFVADVLDVQG